jgi:hypothetical protein
MPDIACVFRGRALMIYMHNTIAEPIAHHRCTRAGVWNNWNIQLPSWIPALAPEFTRPYAVDAIAKVLLSVAAFYPEASWGLATSNADVVRWNVSTMASLGI